MSNARALPDASPDVRTQFSKVPETTVAFWIIKILTTGMGEVVADDLMARIGIPLTTTIAGVLTAAALVWQFREKRYRAWPYWTTAAMVSIFGTTLGDGPRRGLGLTFLQTSVIFGILVVIALGAWYAVERTLSIHAITTRRRETFYWFTVAATFALGTAVGDLFTYYGSGFLHSAMIFALLMLVAYVGYRLFGLNDVVAFWFAYVMTRPLGASIADWTWVPQPFGAGLGKGRVAILSVLVFLPFLAYMAKTRNGEPKELRASV